MGYLDYAGLQYLWGKLKEKFAPKSHSHDDRYYTESEVNTLLASKVHEETITDARDLNTVKTTGIYHLKTTNFTNGPGITNHCTLIVDYTVGTPYQIYIPDSKNQAFRRNYNNSSSVWNAWSELKLTDTNTWRGIQNNLTSDSTTDSLSAAQGKALKTLVDGKAPNGHRHSSISTIADNRNTNTTPNDYENALIFQGLKDNSKINSPSSDAYSYLLGLRGWNDSSGGNSHELAFNNTGVYWRKGDTTSWNSWHRIYTDNYHPIADVANSVDWSKVQNKPSSYPPASHSHAYLPISGGTMTGNITFSDIGDTATSHKISWAGSTDGADIYYQTTAKDQGNLVLNLRDDANCYLRIAYNGAFKSYFSPSDGNFHGNVNGNATSASGYTFKSQTSDPGANSSLATGTVLFVYE